MPECVMAQACALKEEGVEPIRLEPFVHQVGGHSSMLQFNDTTVCKPLINREYNFYETMPPEMKEFTPQCRGLIEVQFVEDSDGYLTLVAYPPQKKLKMCPQSNLPPSGPPSCGGEAAQSDSDSECASASTKKQRFRIQHSGNIELEDGSAQDGLPSTSSSNKHVLSAGPNPWSLHCHKAQLAKMRKNSKGSRVVHKFMLLENLACQYKLPCILDLKMGTRQHGDDASEEKRRVQTQKCESSTSSTLGARICGMQLFQADKGQYICHDKYYGRRLNVQGMHDTLCVFLHNGYDLRQDLLDPIIEQLQQLHDMLSKQHTFRFYSSSLLIMYDGAEGWNNGPAQCNACRDVLSGVASGTSSNVHDGGCGLQAPYGDPDLDSDCSMMGEDSDSRDSIGVADSAMDTSWHTPYSSLHCPHQSAIQAPRVDVRMIDFAHVTYQGFRGDKLVHHGPDHGYLFGLENLIHMFNDIKHSRESASGSTFSSSK